jgi:hypothetical protein
MAPTSSPRPSDGTDTARSPPASPFITSVIAAIGRMTPNATPKTPAPMMRNTTAETPHSSHVNMLTRSVAATSVAAFWSLVCLTISSMTARCAA